MSKDNLNTHQEKFDQNIRHIYDARNETYFQTLKNSAFELSRSKMHYFFIFYTLYIFCCAFLINQTSLLSDNISLHKILALFGFLITLMLSFYINSCYARYEAIFKCVYTIEGRVRNGARLLSCGIGHFEKNDPPKDKACQQIKYKIVRLLSLAHHLVFKEITKDKEFSHLLNIKLIKQDELNLLFGLNDGTSKQKNKPTIIKFHQYLYVLNWCMQTLLIAKEKKLIIDNFLLYHFNNLLNEFRASTGSLYDKINNPIPYSYYWLIRFLTSIFLMLLPFGFLTTGEQNFPFVLIIICSIAGCLFTLVLFIADQLSYPLYGSTISLDINRSLKHALMCSIDYIRPDLNIINQNQIEDIEEKRLDLLKNAADAINVTIE